MAGERAAATCVVCCSFVCELALVLEGHKMTAPRASTTSTAGEEADG
jgi:hypothetical protein